jgi:NAD(P)-dependent dehydrogenase (short-subunit alcohol dehydrogenase family)
MVASWLAGKTALVTGAARRIGRAVSLDLAASGSNVVVHYSSSAGEAEALASEISRLGVRAIALRADLAKPDEVERLVALAEERAGPLDVLVNNASVFEPETIDAASLDRLVRSVEVNAWAPFVLTRAFARRFGRGRVVNLLDTRVSGLDLAHVGYVLGKQLLAVLTRMTAVAFAPGLTVNAVAPGLILPPAGEGEEYLARLAHGLPLQRHGAAEDVARAVLFLLESDFITGQVVFVDGGRHLVGASP